MTRRPASPARPPSWVVLVGLLGAAGAAAQPAARARLSRGVAVPPGYDRTLVPDTAGRARITPGEARPTGPGRTVTSGWRALPYTGRRDETPLRGPWRTLERGPDRAHLRGVDPAASPAPRKVTRSWPSPGEDFEGWRPLSRRYLAHLVSRVLRRYQRALEFPSVEAPPDVEAGDLAAVVRALGSEVMRAPEGKFTPRRPVTRLELAVTLDRLGRRCRGWPLKLPRRRFRFPVDVYRTQDQVDALDRMLRLRVMRADKRRFRPRATVSRYGAVVALDRLLEILGTRAERPRVEFPDVAPDHYARLAMRDLHARGILGPPLLGDGDTRLDPGPHRLLFARREDLRPLSRRPYQVRSDLDLTTSDLPAARELDRLSGEVQNEATERALLARAWDQLRVTGKAAGAPLAALEKRVREHRRRVGRLHLAMGRLYEDLPRAPRGSEAASLRVSLAPAVKAARLDAKRIYRNYTRLYDRVRGVAATPLPATIPPGLPLAARGTSLAGILPGGVVTGVALGAVEENLALAPRTRDRGVDVLGDAGGAGPGATADSRGGVSAGDPGGEPGGGLGDIDLGGDLGDIDLGGGLGDDLGDDLGGGLGDDLGDADPPPADPAPGGGAGAADGAADGGDAGDDFGDIDLGDEDDLDLGDLDDL